MSNERAAPETKGVTVALLATVDLGPEVEGMAGRQLRTRTVTIEPGGVLGPVHDHKDRPGIVYVLQGTITDHRNGVATDYGPGVGWPEDRNTTHWLENRGTTPAVEVSVDIVRHKSKLRPDIYPYLAHLCRLLLLPGRAVPPVASGTLVAREGGAKGAGAACGSRRGR
jgi:quercetin dioxygenase-like cupin family protein